MRPVLLELDGFCSYRTKASVDFRDADFFVLVGPTGSGKSTIIDAMIFALYGTVPRWDNRSAVAPALAPTAARGVVRLIFDLAGRRFSVVRDVRRGGGRTQAVTIREARLEEFVSPLALGASDDETTTLESGSPRVTTAVERLLGPTFDQFTQAVALPQGDFARFLHATDGDRQDILKNLLGYGIYDGIQRAASSRASANKMRAETLTEQLAGYADATEENVAALRRTRTKAKDFEKQVTTVTVPALTRATEEVTRAAERVVQLNAELDALLAVVIPAGVADLDTARQAKKAALATAETQQSALEERDHTARAALHAAPPRHQLEQTLANWREREQITAELPALIEAAAAVDAELQKAATTRERADTAANTARAAATEFDRVAELRAREHVEARDRLAALHRISAPEGLDALTETLRDAACKLTQAKSDLGKAEEVQKRAADELEELPDPAAMAAAVTEAEEIISLVAGDVAASAQRSQSAAALATAQQEAAQAAEQAATAEAAVHDAERADKAAAIRTELTVGDDCPVCGQTVTHLPPESVAADIEAARSVAEQARDRARKATTALTQLEVGHNSAVAVRSQQLRRCEDRRVKLLGRLTALDMVDQSVTLRNRISEETSDEGLSELSAEVSTARASLAAAQGRRAKIEDKRKTADGDVIRARGSVRAAEQAATAADNDAASARTALGAARDSVSALDPPAIDDGDIRRGWDQLTAWVSVTADACARQFEALSQASEDANDAASRGHEERKLAEEAAAESTNAYMAAAVAKERAEQQLQMKQQREAELTRQLSAAPGVDDVREQLDHVIALEVEVNAASSALGEARTAVSAAKDALAQVEAAIEASWQQLRRSRDPLTQFGAPEITGTDIAAGWQLLADWCAAEASSRETQIEAAERVASEADTRAQAARTSLVEALTAEGVTAPSTEDAAALCAEATHLAASAVATAQAALKRGKERLNESKHMQTQMKTAKDAADVAHELANLMRSNNFPRWLIASALDMLLLDASAILMELSGGQFSLSRDERDLLVIDHNDADMPRLVKTLSGGETFQASLALALALSEQVTSLSAVGASKLESIFLDEGFGTLDEVTLETVAGTLENLVSSGKRIVGVITHVPALAERIPVRFQVTRDGAGSHIERQGI
jgi:DNA repair protein SbcC/Rad50